jgi:hypothetical protein
MKAKGVSNVMFPKRSEPNGMGFVVFSLAFSLIAFALITTSWAGDRFMVKGSSVFSFFETVDGCISTIVNISADEQVYQQPPESSLSEGFINVFIIKTDTCDNYAPLLEAGGFGTLANSDLEVGKNLGWARLNTTINVYDSVSNSNFDVFVDLAWTATGKPGRFTYISHDKSPGLIFRQTRTGTSCVAEVAGYVSDGTTNFTPNPTPDGYISSVKTGSITIFK